jgi:hypothetical protein
MLVTAKDVPSSLILITLMMEVIISSVTTVLTRVMRRNIPEDSSLRLVSYFFKEIVKLVDLNIRHFAEQLPVVKTRSEGYMAMHYMSLRHVARKRDQNIPQRSRILNAQFDIWVIIISAQISGCLINASTACRIQIILNKCV